jgi:F-type H+-transporting ATPase subunit delta
MNAATRARKSARRLFRDCFVASGLDENRARRVVISVIDAGRRDALPLLTQFHRLVRLEHDRHRAIVESATPLPSDLQKVIGAGLARIYGPSLDSTFLHNVSLIGGLRIRVGSDVYDGSIRGRLAALEGRL